MNPCRDTKMAVGHCALSITMSDVTLRRARREGRSDVITRLRIYEVVSICLRFDSLRHGSPTYSTAVVLPFVTAG